MPARPAAAISTTPATAMALKRSPADPARPTGFRIFALAVKMVGENALPRAHPARPAPAAQATDRQRREGSFPVGNSSTTNTHSPKPSRYRKPSQLARVSVRGKRTRNTPNPATANTKPTADSSHPIGFSGRFHASSAPTVANAPMNAAPATPSAALPTSLASLAGSG
jgi:hypothetical protein